MTEIKNLGFHKDGHVECSVLITSDSLEDFEKAIDIVYNSHGGDDKYKIEDNCLTLTYQDIEGFSELPFKLYRDNVWDFIVAWLKTLEEKNLKGNGQGVSFTLDTTDWTQKKITIQQQYYGK